MKKAKNVIIMTVGALIFIAGLCLLKTADSPQVSMRALPFICLGVGSGTLGYGVSNMVTDRMYQRHPDRKKQQDIANHDERNILVANRAKAKAFDLALFVLCVLVLVFALMGVEAIPVLLLVLAYLFVQGYAIYYRCKYEKEM